MQIEAPAVSDFPPKQDLAKPYEDGQKTDEMPVFEWLVSRQTQEPIIWPRIFPGL